MAALLDLISLLVLLTPAGCGDPQQGQENISPVINMKFDSRKKMLTWNYRRNVTQQECSIHTPPNSSTWNTPQVQDNDTYFCEFPNCVLHRGATLTLNVMADGAAFQEVLAVRNSGREGSGAVNFSCLIYDLRFLNCSWTPGPAAPADVQYHLYWWASRHEREAECPHYVVDSTGTRVGCHVDELGEPTRSDNYFFLVNGTSNETAIPFLDFTPFRAVPMEKYNPPANVTLEYNGSHHIIRWDNPETRFDLPSHMLYYELDIQREGSSYKRDPVFQPGRGDNEYVMPGSAVTAEDTFRGRVKYKYGDIWSEWSPTQKFTAPPEQDSASTLVALVGLVGGTVALLVVVLMFLCKRSGAVSSVPGGLVTHVHDLDDVTYTLSLRQKLFPPIPQVKMERGGSFLHNLETAWDGGSQEPEDVLTVEEMQSFVREPAETVGSAPPPDDATHVTSVHSFLDS